MKDTIAITTDGKDVVDGIFTFVGTHGIPLEVVLANLKEANIVIDWMDYIRAARKDGHNLDTIYNKISMAIGDVYGPKYKEQFLPKLKIAIIAINEEEKTAIGDEK